jgi:hypothetical protein
MIIFLYIKKKQTLLFRLARKGILKTYFLETSQRKRKYSTSIHYGLSFPCAVPFAKGFFFVNRFLFSHSIVSN